MFLNEELRRGTVETEAEMVFLTEDSTSKGGREPKYKVQLLSSQVAEWRLLLYLSKEIWSFFE